MSIGSSTTSMPGQEALPGMGPLGPTPEGGPEGAKTEPEGNKFLGPEVEAGLASLLGITPEQLESFKLQFDGQDGVQQGAVTPGTSQEGLEQIANQAVEGDSRTAALSLLNVDTIISALDTLVDYSMALLDGSTALDPKLVAAVKDLGLPGLEPADPSKTNTKMSSADVYGLVAKVLAKLADLAYRSKVVESQINNMATKIKQENQSVSNIMTQKQMSIASAQQAKAERLETHGKVMKATTIIVSIVMFVVVVVVILIMAVICIIAIVGTAGAATPLVIAAVAVLIGVVVALATIAIAAQAAVTTVTIYTTATDAMAEGGMVDDILAALGVAESEFNRILVMMIIQFSLALVGGLASLAMTLPMIPMTMALNVAMVVMVLLQIAMQAIMLLVATFVSSGFLQWAVKELAMAAGMDERDAMILTFWVMAATMLAILAVSMAMMVAMIVAGANAVGTTANTATKSFEGTMKTVQDLGKFIKLVGDNMSNISACRNLFQVAMFVQAVGQVISGAAQIVQGISKVHSGALKVQIAKLEMLKADIEFKQELLQIMNQSLKALIDMGMELMGQHTDDALYAMEQGASIWSALGRAGTAVNERSS